MPVRMIFDSGQQYSGHAFADCMQGARIHAIPAVRVQRGMRWSSDDGVKFDIIAPSLPTLVDTGDDINENSIFAMLSYLGPNERSTTLSCRPGALGSAGD
jgi:hypothetical protein